jgi:hypothetical protein
MESLLEVPVQCVGSHALPFRVLLEEYRRRRFTNLLRRLKAVIAQMHQDDRPSPGSASTADQQAEEQLRVLLKEQEAAYQKLENATKAIADGTERPDLDGLVKDCQKADQPLKKLLHRMDASAVCLSGGGIRSASISLGVLQGLARFGAKAPAETDDDGVQRNIGLMPSLDFLSTVSGGGYMGSWMMSWVFRRMEACSNATLLQAMLTSAKNARRLLGEHGEPDAAAIKEIESLANTLACESGSWTPPDGNPALADLLAQMSDVKAQIETVQEMNAAWRAAAAGQREVERKALADALVMAQNQLEVALGLVSKLAYEEVLCGLAGQMPTTSGDPEPQTVRHLRSYTSYLTPDLGLTLDTLTLVAIVLRNFVVNWLMLLPVLIALIAGVFTSALLLLWVRAGGWLERRWLSFNVRWFRDAEHSVRSVLHLQWLHLWRPLQDVASVRPKEVSLCVLFGMVAWIARWAIPSIAEQRGTKMRVRRQITYVFLGIVLVAGWLFSAAGSVEPKEQNFLGLCALAAMGFSLLSWATYKTYAVRAEMDSAGASRKRWAVVCGLTGATVFMALATGGVFFGLQAYALRGLEHGFLACHSLETGRLFAIFAFPLVIVTLMLCSIIYCALIGLLEGEDDREWWARCSGFLLLAALAWLVAHALVLYGNGVFSGTISAISAISGTALGGFASFLGFSGKTPASNSSVNTGELSGIGKFLLRHNLVLPVVGGAAILLIAFGMVWVEEQMRRGVMELRFLRDAALGSQLLGSLLLCLLATVVAFGFNFAININLFSLHGMYRMRLTRAFLGASNVFRQPDLFTEFDRKDTPHEALMPCFAGAPMHLLNATLNLTGTKNTAWRQRKAEGFNFSPVVCGGWRVGFVPTTMYAGSKGLGNKNNGLTLATAMAISGAAANPNMGYQSSPVLSLLMTFFNLRLGCWLPNPARPTSCWPGAAQGEVFFRKSGPTLALWPLMAEALELTDDKYRWVELTDGGHFEDLALYEMVLRRVKNIIVVDGGADGTYGFEDLGNAVRKIQIDLGIPIEFKMPLGMKKPPDDNSRYCAVATIGYTCIDQGLGFTDGTLVYIKASLTGREPADILQYARTHDSFPHESTGDQFFTESQFESYRHLGSFMVEEITRDTTNEDGSSTGRGTMQEFIAQAKIYSS